MGAILLPLGPREFRRLPKQAPTIWVTAPTKEAEDLGFAVNGAFAVDVGRAQLARESARNRQLAVDLGWQLGSVLGALAHLSSTWERLREALSLAEDADPYDFWESLWELLTISLHRKLDTGDRGGATYLVKSLLWDREQGAATRVFSIHAVLPTRLYSNHRVLTRLKDIRLSAAGSLETEAIFSLVSEWPAFRRRVQPGAVVSDKRVLGTLRRLCPELVPPTTNQLSLDAVLEWELESDGRAGPELAQRIGKVVHPDFLDDLRQGTIEQATEHARLESLLGQVRFRARDGEYRRSRELLVASDAFDDQHVSDEADVAAFAPPASMLDDDYLGDALRLFRACRGRSTSWLPPVVDWVLEADGEPRQLAALGYLATGRLSAYQCWALRARLSGTWLDKLPDSPLLARLDLACQRAVLDLLGMPRHTPSPPPSLDPAEVLDAVYDWWKRERATYTRRYETRWYLDGVPPQVDGNLAALRHDTRTREEWLSLFFYGITHTMGRTRVDQHRGFLKLCRERGWLTTFADPDRSPDRWLRIVEEYLDRQADSAEYYAWMSQFVGIYQLARWLDEYVEAFLQIDRMRLDFRLDTILAPRSSALFQGGGADAPSLTRVLGAGACFVVRELVRAGVLKSPWAYPHCYVPSGRVRRLLEFLGWADLDDDGRRYEQSRAIYAFLCQHIGADRATFGGSFDLPFLTIAEDNDLQRQFLGEVMVDDDSDKSVGE